MGKKLNVGAGMNLNIPGDWIHIDIFPQHSAVMKVDVDDGLPFDDSSFDELRCWGCITEFKNNIVVTMNEFWRVLENGGVLDVLLAVVDGGTGVFRDPTANRYLSSQWVQYFYKGGGWETSGHGLGFKGEFNLVSSTVSGESHHVILKAIK